MSVAISGGGKAVGDAWVHFGIIPLEPTDKKLEIPWTKHLGEVILVGDLLNQSTYNSTAFLEQPLVVPKRVNTGEVLGTEVVLSKPDRVHDGERELFVAAHLSTEEAVHAVRALNEVVLVDRKRRLASGEWRTGKKKTSSKSADGFREFFV